ncbi:putative palmitoyl-CoA hydrolase [Helianthus annuus]|uniref:Palmitoyl-CoA hydrolase n=1 Tax=Helianthus annuus TaxID=4232 RepID=A0A9K3J605_HELAN|nr:putative palmitoyl-CoA hydrolase [Helianthus annuus]KAJ0580037.1 putative palmitoyl-CoA hydrolase [Helianthus annuus]KAJ0595951.1 putative palmitoyl-CoA hydrolase [Helianthus annuus]
MLHDSGKCLEESSFDRYYFHSSIALAAASKTVDSLKIVHSLHVYFLLVGILSFQIYHVHRVRDDNSFATRRIDAIQKGVVVFTMIASFQKEEVGFDHQIQNCFYQWKICGRDALLILVFPGLGRRPTEKS